MSDEEVSLVHYVPLLRLLLISNNGHFFDEVCQWAAFSITAGNPLCQHFGRALTAILNRLAA